MAVSKTVYFPDYPKLGKTRSGLTIPFAEHEGALFSHVAPLSSLSLRRIIGFDSFRQLEAAAGAAGRPVATFARETLAERLATVPLDSSADNTSIQATFRGGQGSPLHDWYPYLEGYSPSFVQNIVRTYAPSARSILDPFCGSGTTALVAASMARKGLFAEVNPVCRFVIETKAKALTLGDDERVALVADLRSIASRLGTLVGRSPRDVGLQGRQRAALGARAFFDRDTADLVLRLRSLITHIEHEQSSVAPFMTIAALRSLVPSSLLVRRGDLRFRTSSELEGFRPDLLAEIRRSIELVASDLEDLHAVAGEVTFVCANARNLHDHMGDPADAVITSPPYLNGTNYFRNTKLELCFLGHLKDRADLRRFRDEAITAGINDVTMGKTRGGEGRELPRRARETLAALSAAAYDVRIPAMVQSYFQEMGAVVENLRKVTSASGVVAIDLGDSCYGGVHVKTDVILAEMMATAGFKKSDHVVLRERQSRDGRQLSQTLQVFQLKRGTPARRHRSGNPDRQESAWRRFREELPHQRGEMAKRNWGHAWHSLCSYQGKLKPSIASTLVEALLPERRGGRFLDPFSGVGTLPFEARLHGHVGYGFDISPAAAVISAAKLGTPSRTEAAELIERLQRWIADPRNRKLDRSALDPIRFNGPLTDYFNPRTFEEVVAARRFFLEHPPETPTAALVMASLLHILHGNRPYALSRRSHPITPFAPTGPAEYRPLIERLQAKLGRALDAAPEPSAPAGELFAQDATAAWPEQVSELDAIITSPPFFDSTRFYSANWMRLWFAGWEADDFDRRPQDFVDERQKRSLEVYDAIFAQARERLRPGGVMAIHLGKSRKCDMAEGLTVIGGKHLDLVDAFSESVDHCESHGIRDKGTVTHHQYLLFRRP